ncbi:hypothetical protein HNY73_001735 [Argiope bruennichi]|uniref:Uncharacterized protein n=1 Tax=Argiope bruennichi TaxID=94029 RepID=A0A8T0FTS3_ARGBR|nr:hypothetical protein HNY73_001735 [Argiope bruennichi]
MNRQVSTEQGGKYLLEILAMLQIKLSRTNYFRMKTSLPAMPDSDTKRCHLCGSVEGVGQCEDPPSTVLLTMENHSCARVWSNFISGYVEHLVER